MREVRTLLSSLNLWARASKSLLGQPAIGRELVALAQVVKLLNRASPFSSGGDSKLESK